MEDFNLDLLQYNHHVPTQEFIDSLFSHAFFSLISNPTRLTSYSATLIDNIFTNKLSQHVFNGIVLNDLSDHLQVFTYFGNETLTRRREKKILSRAISAIAGFHCHAIKIRIENYSMNEVKKFTCYRR